MKTLKRLLVTSVAVFTTFYIGGSLISASLNINHWKYETRAVIFGISLGIIVLGMMAMAIEDSNNKK